MKKEINIGKHIIGFEHPVYFIADIAANHDGDIERAKDLIWKVADNGGQAVKFQNFFAETIVSDYGFKSLSGQKSHQSKWKKSIFEVYQDASLPLEWATVLRETANEAGVDYLTAPYDLNLIRKLDEYVCAWKLGSGDITWHEEIELLAKSGKPLLIATGATSMQEVRYAVKVALNHTDNLVLMQCNTNYTASIENFHYISLNVLKKYAYEWPNVILGLSDHTPDYIASLGAVAMGACVLEKHFTLNKKFSGPDQSSSLDPEEFKNWIKKVRAMEVILGSNKKSITNSERENLTMRKILVIGSSKKGSKITYNLLRAKRGDLNGILPMEENIKKIIEKKLKKNIHYESQFNWNMI